MDLCLQSLVKSPFYKLDGCKHGTKYNICSETPNPNVAKCVVPDNTQAYRYSTHEKGLEIPGKYGAKLGFPEGVGGGGGLRKKFLP